jgi:hypothetical protein
MDLRELAVCLAQHGIRSCATSAESAVANADAAIRAQGNAAIASALELLGGVGVVVDVQPWFDANGMGFTYRLAEPPGDRSDAAIARWVQSKLRSTASSTSESVAVLKADCERVSLNATYADDLLASLRELAVCFDSRCYIACLALCGKVLEIALKQLLIDNNVPFDQRWMIGRLLTEARERALPNYLDPSLQQIGEIINRSRIPAVHAVERVPVPSEHQAAMVINATIDTVRRIIVAS